MSDTETTIADTTMTDGGIFSRDERTALIDAAMSVSGCMHEDADAFVFLIERAVSENPNQFAPMIADVKAELARSLMGNALKIAASEQGKVSSASLLRMIENALTMAEGASHKQAL